MRVSEHEPQLISQIYDVVLEPEARPAVMDAVVERCGARAAVLWVYDHRTPELRLNEGSARYRDPELLRDFTEKFAESIAAMRPD